MDLKDWRFGKKGRLRLSAPRKKIKKRTSRGWFLNKKNIPPVPDMSKPSIQESFEQNICQAEVLAASSAQCQNISVVNDPSGQIISDIPHELSSPQSRLQWLQLIRRDDLQNKPNYTAYRVCEKHFNKEDVLQSLHRKLLKKNVVPSLMLPSFTSTVPGVSGKEDKQTQTAPLVLKENSTQTENETNEIFALTSTSLSSNTARKRKLIVELIQCRKKINKLKRN